MNNNILVGLFKVQCEYYYLVKHCCLAHGKVRMLYHGSELAFDTGEYRTHKESIIMHSFASHITGLY